VEPEDKAVIQEHLQMGRLVQPIQMRVAALEDKEVVEVVLQVLSPLLKEVMEAILAVVVAVVAQTQQILGIQARALMELMD
jgi:hypothetical protein